MTGQGVRVRLEKGEMQMSENNRPATKKEMSYIGICLALGLVFGGIIGLVIDNLIIFAGGGLVLGLAIGSALDAGRQSNKSK